MERHCILIVDDEPNIRSSLTRLFQREGFETLLAENGEDAFRLLKKRTVSVILSDYVMPGQLGVDFLREVKTRFPRMVRMILSGRADMKVVMQAVDDGVVSNFFLKPWDNDVLKKTIHQAIKQLEHNSDLQEALYENEKAIGNFRETFKGISNIREAENGAIIIDD